MAEQEKSWRVNREININSLLQLGSLGLMLIVMGIGAFSWGSTVENRITAVETSQQKDMQLVITEIKSIRNMRDNDITSLNASLLRMNETMNRLDSKIDKLIQQR